VKPLWYYRNRTKEEIRHWLFWYFTGWPFKKRCPQCAGSGRYATDSMAMHPDPFDIECPMCAGKGLIKRSAPWRRQ